MTITASAAHAARFYDAGLRWAGYLLGFAMGGFFDGILFHQVLQWHHLMSLVDLPFLATLEGQVLADGLFHVTTYLIAALGLWLLWRRLAAGGREGDRMLLATFLIGFGAWHIVDNILVHWILGWHHIRLPPYNPILWDMITFVAGLAFVAWGWWVWRRQPPAGPRSARGGGTVAALIAVSTLIAGPVAALPPSGPAVIAVQFPPSMSEADAFGAIAIADGRVVSIGDGNVWFVEIGQTGRRRMLAGSGARLVAQLPIGCFAREGA